MNNHGILYLHFAEAFGARQMSPEALDESGRVDFEKMRRLPVFKSGMQRLHQGVAKGYVIAMMCAESDPVYEKKLPRPDVFQSEISREEKLKLAFRLRNGEVGWKAADKA